MQGFRQPLVYCPAAYDQMADAAQPFVFFGYLQGILNRQRHHGGKGDFFIGDCKLGQ